LSLKGIYYCINEIAQSSEQPCPYNSNKRVEGVDRLAINREGITIGTISGGIVNFGGAVYIAPISVTTTNSGSGSDNTGTEIIKSSGLSSTTQRNIIDILELIKAML
jgi:hypothetical protein